MSDQNTDEISLKELLLKSKAMFNYLISKWKIIFLVAVFGGILGWAYAKVKKPVYTATLSFILERDKNVETVFSGENFSALVKSKILLRETLLSPVAAGVNGDTISLADMYFSFNKFKKKDSLRDIQLPYGLSASVLTRAQDSVLEGICKKLLKGNLNIEKKDKNNAAVTTIEIKAESELFSKYFAENLLKKAFDIYTETRNEKIKLNLDLLQQQIDSVRIILNNYSSDRVDYTLGLKEGKRSFSKIEAETNVVVLAELVRNLELGKVAIKKDTSIIHILDRPVLPLKKEYTTPLKGIVLGMVLAVFLVVMFLIVRSVFREIMREPAD